MTAEAEETYSTLQVQRLEVQRGGSGLEVTDSVDLAPFPMRSLSSDQCAMTILPGLASPDIQLDESGLIVASALNSWVRRQFTLCPNRLGNRPQEKRDRN